MPKWSPKYLLAWNAKYDVGTPKEAPKTLAVSAHPSEHVGHWYVPPEECIRLNAVWAHMIKSERPKGTLPIECDLHDKMQYWMECGFPEETYHEQNPVTETCLCNDCVWLRHPDRTSTKGRPYSDGTF